MKTNLTKLVVVSILALASAAGATTLWDQSDFDPFGAGFFNSESGGPPFGMTNHAINHITVDNVWRVDSITTFYSALDPAWADGIIEGYLHVFAKTGPLPDDDLNDPALSPVVPMSGVFNNDHIVVSATDLNLTIEPGEYWIGITPVAPSGPFGPEIHLSSMTLIGDATASYDVYAFPGPPAWFNFNPDVDASILLDGEITTAPTQSTWGAVKSLFR